MEMLERLETFADHGGASMQDAQELASDAALEIKRLSAENRRLSGGLIAIHNAPKTIGSSVLRTIAYDIALNCIDPDTADFQIKRRGGFTQAVNASSVQER